MSKRKLIDIQYYSNKDMILMHEIVDGVRTYTPIYKPTYSFSVLKPEFEAKREDFFVPVDRVDNFTGIPFSSRHYAIAEILGYDKKEIKNLRGDALKNFKKEVMLNPRLFFADNSITFDTNMNYQQYFKEEIDPTIQTKILSFDIEVHSDYHFNIYKVLLTILDLNDENDLTLFKTRDDILKTLKISNSSVLKMDIEKNYMLFMNDVYNKTPKISYKDLVLATQSVYTSMEYLEFIKEYIRDNMNDFYNNLGFPDQNKAANRIDAISSYDSLEACMYLYLLVLPEDINRDFNEWLIDSTKVSDELSLILDAYKQKIYLNAHKTFPKQNKEVITELSTHLEDFCRTGNEYSRLFLEETLERIKALLPEIESLKNITLKFKPFFDELSLIKAFFTDIREVIQPNVMLAHNMFFDVVTLYNRLYRYGENPNYWFNQFGYETDDSENDLEVDFRIDFKAKNKKQDKSYVKVAGLVILDSLLLIAKTSQRERDFSLDACAVDMLKETKFKYDSDSIINLYSDNIRQFSIYSCLDTFLVDRLNNKMGFIDMFQALLDDCCSVWAEYAMKSIFLTNITKKELLMNNGLATRNNISEVLNAGADDSKFEGALIGAR